MEEKDIFTVINQQNGNLAFKLFSFNDNSHFDYLQRNNFYTIIWVKSGNGLLKVDFSEYLFEENVLFSFAPYQPFMISTDKKISGIALQFHSEYYCIHRNPKETNCDTLLFNNIYQEPFIKIDKASNVLFEKLIQQVKTEFQNEQDSNHELLIPTLKIFLVTASRIKSQANIEAPKFTDTKTPYVLRNLKSLIENNFKEKHAAGEYAVLLNISSNALAKLVKTHFNKTLSSLINERIIIEAKRELYLTDKTVKEIAYELGYEDEYYFSRFFKVNADVSPQLYRDTVGYAKAMQ
jgi:AraC-like DNA-binding protein